MHRLLIVDDEPYTVDGLYELLSATGPAELELYRAYDVDEAADWLNRVKMDIVLSDIKMPGMNGLQLQSWIKDRWPRCKVIFLTGMKDVGFVQQALRCGSLDYILKTEGDEPILRSIAAAIESLEHERCNESFLLQAKERVRQALPVLRNDWFRGLLQYGADRAGISQSRMEELDSQLHAELPVLLMLARVDHWPDHVPGTDRSLLLYAIENIIMEYFSMHRFGIITIDDSYIALLFQPGEADEEGNSLPWEGLLRFASGTVETVQTTCLELLKLPISFICREEPLAWDRLRETYLRMRERLVLGLGNGENMMLLASERYVDEPMDSQREMLGQREWLELALESGRTEEAHAAIDAWFVGASDYAVYLEAYYSVASRLIGLVNRWDWVDRLAPQISLEKLMDIGSHRSWEGAVHYLHETTQYLFSMRRKLQVERTHHIVEQVNRQIRDGLSTDVSLTSLAQGVFLNPVYLSTLYKQVTGQNISDYIVHVRLEKAKEKLADPHYKIHEVASLIGFENPGYFTRFFRKHIGICPQEYREQLYK
ncbi:hypothetical protein Back11_00600 [Paenibacillus baekrokdamisoli]|uniref:Uncharacterized protein n=1 Tax=Paenibacillus baekrokdamisoli TaxID=1712516 RepID=A0A3G9IRX5_9BACL|nr:response regulator [Paenibacillus baekrokdamisoli]MBB3069313.1 two-component system response regulator YesN [Paenibacillus baekrokdamisoli]BBH18715.1 hypothetical protein Back11_00600 [Paenibacillus baekrokdamisoli]